MNALSIEQNPQRLATVSDPDGRFRRNYNRVNFMFEHGLSGNPLFELDSLVALTQRLPDHGEHY